MNDMRRIAQTVIQLATDKNVGIVTAESCTGGAIAATMARIPGASMVLTGGFVVYTQLMKESVLRIPYRVIAREGIVSVPVARMMARAALGKTMSARYSVAVTGYAGPTGYPVGKVVVAWAERKFGHIIAYSRILQLQGTRTRVIDGTVANALQGLVALIQGEIPSNEKLLYPALDWRG